MQNLLLKSNPAYETNNPQEDSVVETQQLQQSTVEPTYDVIPTLERPHDISALKPGKVQEEGQYDVLCRTKGTATSVVCTELDRTDYEYNKIASARYDTSTL